MSLFVDTTNNALGDILIHLKGNLDYISSVKLRTNLYKIREKYPTSNIVINMDSLEFVGSSGIGHFIESINMLNQQKIVITLTNVHQEFIKTFRVFEIREFDKVVKEGKKIATRSYSI